jgi:SAM-dependent methyltransferase
VTPNADVRTIYENEYQLAASSPKSDAARARAYRSWITAECSAPRTILEIGCGSGALLSEFLQVWPNARGYGIDPALPGNERKDDNIRLARGFVEDIPKDAGDFDLIVAVNVIEHTPDPRAFLDALRRRLAPNGRIIIVCPVAQTPNVELLFFDHLYSLTPNTLRIASETASLKVKKQALAPRQIGDFQMIVLDAAGTGISQQDDQSAADLHSKRQSYLDRWRLLDQVLIDRSKSSSRLVAFGGGQTAALLRAYAPRTWARIDSIVLDDPNEAWRLGPPIALYRDAVQDPAGMVLVATSPHVQNVIAERLNRDGLLPIIWNDIVTN